MATDGINGSGVNLSNLSAGKLKNMKEGEFDEAVSIFDSQVRQELKTGKDKINTSDGINSREKSILLKWADKIDEIIGNIAPNLAKACGGAINKLLNLHASLIKTSGEKVREGENTYYENGATYLMENETDEAGYEPENYDVDDLDIPESYRKEIAKINKERKKYSDMDADEFYLEVQRRLKQASADKLAGTFLTKEQIAQIGNAIKEARSEDDLVKRLESMGYSKQKAVRIARS